MICCPPLVLTMNYTDGQFRISPGASRRSRQGTDLHRGTTSRLEQWTEQVLWRPSGRSMENRGWRSARTPTGGHWLIVASARTHDTGRGVASAGIAGLNIGRSANKLWWCTASKNPCCYSTTATVLNCFTSGWVGHELFPSQNGHTSKKFATLASFTWLSARAGSQSSQMSEIDV